MTGHFIVMTPEHADCMDPTGQWHVLDVVTARAERVWGTRAALRPVNVAGSKPGRTGAGPLTLRQQVRSFTIPHQHTSDYRVAAALLLGLVLVWRVKEVRAGVRAPRTYPSAGREAGCTALPCDARLSAPGPAAIRQRQIIPLQFC